MGARCHTGPLDGALTAAVLCLLAAAWMPAAASAAGPAAPAIQVGMASGSQRLHLVLPLAARDSGLAHLARAVTTPGSHQYGHYRSIAQLSYRYGATSATRRRVASYLRRVGAIGVRIDATGLFADATMTAGLTRRLFSAPLARFRTVRHVPFLAPTAAVRVPRALRGLVEGVVGLDTRPLASSARAPLRPARSDRFTAHAAAQPSSAQRRTGTPSGCAQGQSAGAQPGDPGTAGFTPNQYLTAYGFTQLHQAGFTGQGVRVALIEIDGFKLSDIQTFAQCFGFGIPPLRAFGVGVARPLAPGGESTLDLEALTAAAPGLKGIDVYETSANAADTLRALTAPLQNRSRRPQVISASLGLCEPAVAGAVGARGINATESALEMAAISGITFLASSGDQGSADCTGPDGLPMPRLSVNYPASSWWVVGVGGTNLTLNSANQITGQVVWNDTDVQPGAAGGGGSSAMFRRPPYQKGTVSTARRAVPDVSMLSDIIPGYAVFCSAQRDCVNAGNPDPWQSVGGTSAATPLLAGGFAIVDQQLELHQRQDLGFANPLIYRLGRSSSRGQAFDDVTDFNNDIGPFVPNASRPLGCCNAGPEYDRASGWGSVNLASFAGLALSRQPPTIHLSLPRRQHPLRRHRLLARVACAGPCRVAAFADVRVGRARPFEVDSRVANLPGTGARTFSMRFSRTDLRRIRQGLNRHQKVVATVFGVVITGRRTLAFRSAAIRVRIRR